VEEEEEEVPAAKADGGVVRDPAGKIVLIPGFTKDQLDLFTDDQLEMLAEKAEASVAEAPKATKKKKSKPKPKKKKPKPKPKPMEYQLPNGLSYPVNDGNRWFSATWKMVPEGAAVMNFVISDGNNCYENNGGRDFHVAVERDDKTIEELVEKRYQELRNERKEVQEEKKRRFEHSSAQKKKFAEQARNLQIRQTATTLFTEPPVPVPGEKLQVYYRPDNTPLHGATAVFMRGAANRWKGGSLGTVEMTPGTKETSGYYTCTVDIPNNAYGIDFVFQDGPGLEPERIDNRDSLDYHIDVPNANYKEPPMHIVHVAVEMAPICKVGGLGDVVTSLGRAVQDLGHRVEVVVPKYDVMKYGLIEDMVELEGFMWGGTYNSVSYGKVENLDVYFIGPQNGFFDCGMIYGADWEPMPMTDRERFGFFSKAALEWMLQSKRNPDIIHCHDWSTGPTAKSFWEDYQPYGLNNPRMVFTIHNLNFGEEEIEEAMTYTQKATTVSPTYASEVWNHPSVYPAHGKFYGIRNGIDPDIWDPLHDEFLSFPYSAENVVEGKRRAKEQLCSHLNMPMTDQPVIGIVSRLTQQKGTELMEHAIRVALGRGCHVCLLGSTFDPDMQENWDQFSNEMKQFNHNAVRMVFSYDEPLSHLIYAGADMLLVPSMFEPCGLSQLIAMRYGTVPVVRRTGGLADTVFDVDHDKLRAEHELMQVNGFSFDGADVEGIEYALHRAIDAYHNDPKWWYETLSKGCMDQDWTWARPAMDYIEMYHSARKN